MSCSCHDDDQPSGLSRRLVLAGGLAAGLSPLLPRVAGAQEATDVVDPTVTPDEGMVVGNDYGFLPPRPKTEKHVRPMMFPVLADAALGKATWSDTYLAPRSGGRLHEGQDLMGNKMLKLLAVVDGTIIELRHQSGGNSLYLKGDDGWYYCYLHINNDDPGTDNGANQFKYAFAPGIAIGKRVLKGDLLAYLGDSGNAEGTGAHCHFEIRMPNAKWYNAAAVNAAYSLSAAEPAKLRPKVSNAIFAPQASASAFVMAQVADFMGGKAPSSAWSQGAVEDLEGAVVTPKAFIAGVLDEEGATLVAATIRLYLGYFLRLPDYGGLDYWIRKVRAGTSLDTASSQFAGGSEFLRRYGELDNEGFLVQIYQNLFDRDPDAGGLEYWKRRLDGGAKRGWVMRQFCESSEYKRTTDAQVKVIQLHVAMLKKMASADENKRWTDWLGAAANGAADLAEYLRTSEAYTARY